MEDRIDRAERELSDAMGRLVVGESFSIVAFDAKSYAWSQQLKPVTPANLASARRFLDDINLDVKEQRSNGTNLLRALRIALQTKGVNSVVIITDGEPTVGETNYATIATKARALNKRGARIDAIGLVGRRPDGNPANFDAGKLLEQLARDGGGEFRAIKDAP